MFLLADILGPLVGVVEFLLQLEIVLILVRVVLSYTSVSRYHPLMQMLYQVTDPVISLARMVPHVFGQFDFSPFIASLGLYVLRQIIANLAFDLLTPSSPHSLLR
ncbi:MAG TPA: YggT family protein [Candidatus Dormibacteraeota bacterium]|jgi:YggT family protein|nr:YggT family protein [Candidatus Dormibacteraeota bacterium]